MGGVEEIRSAESRWGAGGGGVEEIRSAESRWGERRLALLS